MSEADHRDELILMAVDAAVGNKSDEVESAGLPFFESGGEDRVLCERAFGDGFVDARKVLIHDAAGAEIQVTDFRVAHLSIGQADIETRGAEEALGVGGEHFIVKRGVGEESGVAILLGGGLTARVDAPSVANDQNYWFLCHARAR